MKKLMGLFFLAFLFLLIINGTIHAAIVISELDCDTESTDTAEFVEILNTGPEAYDFSADPVVLVFFDGNDDASYRAVDLGGTLEPGEMLVVGQPAVLPAPDIVIESSFIQNGADAIALYLGDSSAWLSDTPASGGYIDALVYGTDDPDDVGLLQVFDVLNGIQVDEHANDNKDYDSIQRIEAGIGGSHFIVGPPNPGESTMVPVPSAAYLLSSGLIAMIWMRSRTKEECLIKPHRAYRKH